MIERRGFLARLADFFRPASPAASRGSRTRRLRVEPLEGRSMLAVMAYDDSRSVVHDQTLYGMSVLMNDFDSQMLMLSASLVSGPLNGTVNLSPNGSFIYIPDDDFAGDDSFVYAATSASGSDQASVNISVTNAAPVANDGSHNVVHDRTLFSFVTAQDGNVDPLTFSVVTLPTHGVLNLTAGGSFTYIPNCGYAGSDSFTFAATDGIATDTGIFTINVTNNAPVATGGSQNILQDQTLSSSVTASDIDGDSITYSVATHPAHGTLNLASAGSFTYIPTAGYNGTDSFVFAATDGLASANGTFTITIQAPTVGIMATDALAKEVGSDPGQFTVTRTGITTNALTVQLGIAGSATVGTDYSIANSVVIPAGALSATIPIVPVMDTTIEGIEDVVVSIAGNAAYLGTGSATVNIRDRAGVKQILATAGVSDIPVGSSGRNVTGVDLFLTQNDVVAFLAVPTDGGDFAPNEPTWTVTGEGATTSETRSVTFGTYRSPDATAVSVSTPADTAPKAVQIAIVPFPTGIAATSIVAPLINYLPNQYGTKYQYALSPSAGATGADLTSFNGIGLLDLKEHVTLELPYTYAMVGWSGPFEKEGSIEGNDAIVLDQNTIGRLLVFPYSQLFNWEALPPIIFPQDMLWRSNAADSLNRGWNEFVTDNPMTHTLGTSGNGFVVTTVSNGVPFTHLIPRLERTWI